jgi:hypothetical protein
MNVGGLAAMLHELLARDISGFELRDAPQTEAMKIQKTLSLSSLEKWWLAALSRGFVWKSGHGANYFRDWQPLLHDPLPGDGLSSRDCVEEAFEAQRSRWLARLRGPRPTPYRATPSV